MEGAPLCPCTDTETSEQEQTLGSWSGFSLKERSSTASLSLSVFCWFFFSTYRALPLLQHFLFTWCPHHQPARTSQKPLLPTLPTCRLSAPHSLLWQHALALSRKVSKWSPSTALSGNSDSSQIFFLFVLPCTRTGLSQIRLVYTRDKQCLKALTKIYKWPTAINPCIQCCHAKRKRSVSALSCSHMFFSNVLRTNTPVLEIAHKSA